MPKIYEYRGVTDLVYARVTKDDSTGYATGEVKDLAGVAEISKTSNSSTEAHYYNNIPAVNIITRGSDTVTISASAIPLDVLADITGQKYDATTGAMIEGPAKTKYFAIGYKTKDTDGNIYYVWRLKGTFAIPDEDHQTEDDGTDANGQELVFTGIATTYIFANGGEDGPDHAMAINVNTGLDLIANKSQFFNSVQTPDTLQPKSIVPSVTVFPSREEVTAGSTVQLTAETIPAGLAVTWSTAANTYATVDANGLVTGVEAGSETVTAKITYDGHDYTDTCAITVNAPEA